MNQEEIQILREILKWTRIQALPSASSALANALRKPEHRKLYEQLDGSKTQQQLAKLLGISQATISRSLASWLRAGVVDETAGGKYVRAFDLSLLESEEKDKNGDR
jgi:Fic family protein